MGQMYKIFVNEQPLISVGNLSNAVDCDRLETHLVTSPESLEEIYLKFESQHTHPGLVIYNNENPERLFDDFKALFFYMEAAGGLVSKRGDEWLFIHRFGHWDLPKGKIEENENPGSAAIREVAEETGIHGHYITRQLPDTYHTYQYFNTRILKRTYWFAMNYDGNEVPAPQTNEYIEQAVWMKKSTIESIMPLIYPSLRLVIAEGMR
ncbi:NUDIX domain protein [anaerobic digester metagenome]